MENTNPPSDLSLNESPERPKYKIGYIIILTIILGLAHTLDEYSSLAEGMIQSSIIQTFFIDTGLYPDTPQGFADALQFMTILGLASIFLLVFSLFYKPLQDKFGRKKIFILAVIGMTVGAVIKSFAPNYPIYYIGGLITSFFILADMQYIYINEETPSKWRTQAFTSAKIIGLLAILVVPLIRKVTITEGSENWRPVFYFPMALGVLVLILSFAFLKESREFSILKEDRKLHPEKYIQEKLNIRQATRDFKKMPTWNQFKNIVIQGAIWAMFALFNGNNEAFMDQVGLLHVDRSNIFIISTVCVGIAYFINGQIADRWGRKPSMIINSTLVAILLPVEYFAVINYASWGTTTVWVAGIAQGLRIGAFWNSGDVRGIVLVESTPTRLRGFAQMYSGLWAFPVIVISVIINYFLLDVFQYTMQISLIIGLPINIICAILVLWKIKETKNVDLTEVEG